MSNEATKRGKEDADQDVDFGDLSTHIAAAELAVIDRDARFRNGIHQSVELAREKAGTGLAIGAGVGGAWWLARQFFPSQPKREKTDSGRTSVMPYALSLLGPVLTRALIPGRGGMIGGPFGALLGLALPKIGSLFAKDDNSRESSAREAPMAPVSEADDQTIVRAEIPAVQSAPAIDLRHYLGHWYEIARLPTSYESHCLSDVTATYELDETPGLISVLNRCREEHTNAPEAKLRSARGVAKVVKGTGNAQLKVCFAPSFLRALPFVWADYWILAFDDDYRYALVGTPDHRNLWLLSRTPQMPTPEREYLIALAQEQGFATESLIFTVQTG